MENVVPTIAQIQTRSGRTVSAPEQLIEVMEPLVEELHSTAAKLRYFSLITECDNEEVHAFMANQHKFSGSKMTGKQHSKELALVEAFLTLPNSKS